MMGLMQQSIGTLPVNGVQRQRPLMVTLYGQPMARITVNLLHIIML